MSTITDKLTYLQDTKTAIKNAIVGKGVNVSDSDTFRSYANKISSITTSGGSSDDWQPQPDWWDIDAILENDTEDYAGKMIVLLNDTYDTTQMTCSYGSLMNADLVKTSDGVTYSRGENINHTWDKTQDKECSLGYKTRYLIFYFKDGNNSMGVWNFSQIGFSLYIVYKNLTITTSNITYQYPQLSYLQGIKWINCTYNSNGFQISNYEIRSFKTTNVTFPSIKSLSGVFSNTISLNSEDINTLYSLMHNSNITNLSGCFQGRLKITTIDLIDTSLVTNFSRTFYDNRTVNTIKNLNFDSATDVGYCFTSCTNLIHIENISNIKKSGISLSNSTLLTHQSLINVLNALYDYSTDEENTYTLTLGTTNLAKLTDEEKKIATDRGWTLA